MLLFAPGGAYDGERVNGKPVVLRESQKGKRKRKADHLIGDEEEALWKSGVLGHTNPQSLNYTMFYQVSQHFGTRGCQEHHQLKLEDLKIVSNLTSGKAE